MKYFFFLLILPLLFFSCEAEDGLVLIPEQEMRVNSYKTSCVGEGPQSCYLVQEGELIGTEDWRFFYGNIIGFHYQQGYLYRLKVRVEKVENPAMDASDRKYILLQVISMEAAD